jgi:hypothetical protein
MLGCLNNVEAVLVEVGLKNEGHNYWKQVKLDYMNADLFPVSLVSGDI